MKNYKKSFISLILLVCCCLLLASCNITDVADIRENVNTITEVYTLGNVKVENRRRESIFGGSTSTLIGSGAIIKEKTETVGGTEKYTYWFLTNNHVITLGNNYSQTIVVYDRYGNSNTVGEMTETSYYKASADYDLALLTFTTSKKLKAISISDSECYSGQDIFSLGSPNSQYNALTIGKSRGLVKAPVVESLVSKITFDVLKHTAKISNGSSGGMVLNSSYEIVGINYAGAEDSDVGYAVPAEKVKEFLSLIEFTI